MDLINRMDVRKAILDMGRMARKLLKIFRSNDRRNDGL